MEQGQVHCLWSWELRIPLTSRFTALVLGVEPGLHTPGKGPPAAPALARPQPQLAAPLRLGPLDLELRQGLQLGRGRPRDSSACAVTEPILAWVWRALTNTATDTRGGSRGRPGQQALKFKTDPRLGTGEVRPGSCPWEPGDGRWGATQGHQGRTGIGHPEEQRHGGRLPGEGAQARPAQRNHGYFRHREAWPQSGETEVLGNLRSSQSGREVLGREPEGCRLPWRQGQVRLLWRFPLLCAPHPPATLGHQGRGGVFRWPLPLPGCHSPL